ncbi:hypothetical protein LY474_08980 [Myxococcus stipitatus]|uniref:hypothetical protein n=1 Tax=Myxococcus stipitatus TaxID=83455 RepID=UPI001F35996B|nr:hypothetical protein [Myxococcus stipitatus]MCE9667942.1 hypothetical protein [Myxococcus stipitatus]
MGARFAGLYPGAMSLHFIEDMVEGAVRVLDRRAPAGDPAPRDQFARLFRFQEGCDCGFTHFRVMDLLLARRFTYRFDLAEHPDYATRRDFFDSLREFTFLTQDASDEEGGAGEEDEELEDEFVPVDGYVEPPHLYCDVGSPLWRRMVEMGRLKGPDAEPATPIPLVDVVHEVMVGAEAEKDLELIAMWFNMGPRTLFADTFQRYVRKGDPLFRNPFTGKEVLSTKEGVIPAPFGVGDLEASPRAVALRDLVRRTRALETPLAYDLRRSPEQLEDDALSAWWWKGL